MTEKKSAAPQDYEVTQGREIAGAYREAGETVSLTPAQAKYYLPPCGSGLKPAGGAPSGDAKPDAEKAATKARKSDA
ncbi:hypothetical protein [Thalassovita aquimarina]|uniref:Uncharacterized protein n=1 Tax=Thalassovita aquimarina TaxID=2785917 RepID=A0ABS5HSP2_9RHOB|nr:hypothetical protein [Thalassovita aquimarina]MBR9651914.1 hypothetical protein [Thalassovita aquimarina]